MKIRYPVPFYLFDIRKYERKKYHDAILYINRNRNRLIRERVANSLISKSFVSFWKEIRYLKGNNFAGKASVMDGCVFTR